MDNVDNLYKKIGDIDGFIRYLETTEPGEWLTDFVRSKDGSKNCLFGHLINYCYGKEYEGNVRWAWDEFESRWATEFMIYPINDGRDSRYLQATAKERIIAYLKDLRDGKELPTWKLEQIA